jgi:hypothetical protein
MEDNLIPLSDGVHKKIHALYRTGRKEEDTAVTEGTEG